jgi:hypothetical protein
MGYREVEIVNVVAVMPHLLFIEIAQGVAHGAGGVGIEVVLGGIEKEIRVGESFLGGQLNFSMWQAGDSGELPSDLSREGKEFVYPFFHDAETLSGYAHARQARAVGYQKMKRGKAVSRKEAGGALVWEEEEGWARHPHSLNTVEAGNRQLGVGHSCPPGQWREKVGSFARGSFTFHWRHDRSVVAPYFIGSLAGMQK